MYLLHILFIGLGVCGGLELLNQYLMNNRLRKEARCHDD